MIAFYTYNTQLNHLILQKEFWGIRQNISLFSMIFFPQNLIFQEFFSWSLFFKGFPRNLCIFQGCHRFSKLMPPRFLEHLTTKKNPSCKKKKKKNLKSDAILSHFHAYNLYDLCSGYGGHNAALFTDWC